MEGGGTGVAESRRIGEYRRTNAAIGAVSVRVDGDHGCCWAAYRNAQDIRVGLWRAVKRRGGDSLTSAVGISKREVRSSVRGGRKIILDCRTHRARR